MDIEQTVSLLDGIASILQAIGWPLALLILAVHYREPVRELLRNVGRLSVQGPAGIGITIEQATEASANLAAAVAKTVADEPSVQAVANAREAARLVARATEPKTAKRLADARILWVDDRPANNVYERRALEALGVRFVISTSTEDALEVLQRESITLVISDMGRPPDSTAGYTLLRKMRDSGDMTPMVIYAGSNAPEHDRMAREAGAVGSTGNPQRLFQLVLDTLHNA